MVKHRRSKSSRRSPSPQPQSSKSGSSSKRSKSADDTFLGATWKKAKSAFEHHSTEHSARSKRSSSPVESDDKRKRHKISPSGKWNVKDTGTKGSNNDMSSKNFPDQSASSNSKKRSDTEASQKASKHINSNEDSKQHNAKSHKSALLPEFEHQSFRIIPLSNPAEILVVLDHNESLTLKGKVNLKCICGSVSVYGHEMTSSSPTYPIFSSNTHSLLSISVLKGCKENLLESPEFLKIIGENNISKKELKTIKNYTNSAVVLLTKLESSTMDLISSLSPFHSLFGADRRDRNVSDVVYLSDVGVRLFSSESSVSRLTTNRDVEQIIEWMKPRLVDGSNPVIIVCGGKNVGKSTLTRYLLNTALNSVEMVAYLECDVGQTEFTPPACVSVTSISQPLFGAPFTHQMKPFSCCYLGALSPAEDPEFYMRCLRSVHDSFKKSKPCPLIINTMGWNKGIGLALLTDTLRLVKPDLVVQIDSKSDYKNYPLISGDFISQNIGWTTQCLADDDNMKQHSLISVNSVPESKNIEAVCHYKPIDHRTLSLVAYFSQSLTSIRNLTDFFTVTPFVIPWHQVAVHVAHASVPSSQIMYALNASVVALCIVDKDMIVSSEKDGYPKFLKETPVCSCLGFGIIRGIDPEKKVFYLYTSLELCDTVHVNCLMRGAVDLPQQFQLLNQKSPVPYVGAPKDVIGASSISKRKHTMRRRPDNAR